MAEYDAIADEYAASKLLPWRTQVEQPTLFGLLGDVRGKSVLDLACGDGIYARMLADRGASRMHGVDLSSGMRSRPAIRGRSAARHYVFGLRRR